MSNSDRAYRPRSWTSDLRFRSDVPSHSGGACRGEAVRTAHRTDPGVVYRLLALGQPTGDRVGCAGVAGDACGRSNSRNRYVPLLLPWLAQPELHGLSAEPAMKGHRVLAVVWSATKATANWLVPCCGLCSHRLLRFSDSSGQIRSNHASFNMQVGFSDALFVCPSCYRARELIQCCKTGRPFLKVDDQAQTYVRSTLREELAPHHPSSHLVGPLSGDGLALIIQEHAAVLQSLQDWAGGTKQEFLPGYRITRELGIIREDGRWADPPAVENALKRQAVQIGANGFIKFFWDKQREDHEESYIAGYGARGNPYYRTRRSHTSWFIGSATAVVAEEVSRGPRRSERSEGRGPWANWRRDDSPRDSTSGRGDHRTERDHATVLGVSGDATREAIQDAYRQKMREYHPDRVASLGAKLREVAEAESKLINEAYAFFRRKFGF